MTGSQWQWARSFGSVSRIRPRLADIWAPEPDEPEVVTEDPRVMLIAKDPDASVERELREAVRNEVLERVESRERVESFETERAHERTERITDRETRFERAMAEVRKMEREIRASHEHREHWNSRVESHSDRIESVERNSDRVESRVERTLERQMRDSWFTRRTDRIESRIREIVRHEISQRSEPDIRVEIGRIDVVPAPATKPGTLRSERKGPILDLETYLKQREDGR